MAKLPPISRDDNDLTHIPLARNWGTVRAMYTCDICKEYRNGDTDPGTYVFGEMISFEDGTSECLEYTDPSLDYIACSSCAARPKAEGKIK